MGVFDRCWPCLTHGCVAPHKQFSSAGIADDQADACRASHNKRPRQSSFHMEKEWKLVISGYIWLYQVISGYIWLYLVIISKLLSGDDVQNLPKKKELNTSEYIRDSCHRITPSHGFPSPDLPRPETPCDIWRWPPCLGTPGHPAMTAMIKHATPA